MENLKTFESRIKKIIFNHQQIIETLDNIYKIGKRNLKFKNALDLSGDLDYLKEQIDDLTRCVNILERELLKHNLTSEDLEKILNKRSDN